MVRSPEDLLPHFMDDVGQLYGRKSSTSITVGIVRAVCVCRVARVCPAKSPIILGLRPVSPVKKRKDGYPEHPVMMQPVSR